MESDVVGYTTIAMQANTWYQIGSPFVGLTEESNKLNNLFTGFASGDTLQILNPATVKYEAYTWNATAGKWLDGWDEDPGISISLGQAVFIYKKTAGTITFAGQVAIKEAGEVTTFGSESGNAWNQAVLLYPETKKLNDLEWTGLADGDTLQILDTATTKYEAFIWDSSTSKWLDGWDEPADVDITPGRAMFINKRSAGQGTISVK